MIALYKQKGETPLQTLERLRFEQPQYADAKLSYAGRLDPMAEGVMLVLVAEENKSREKHLRLDKTYVTEILFGVSTDTGDVLGIPRSNTSGRRYKGHFGESEIKTVLEKSVGKFSQKYPAYSSKSFDKDYKSVQEGRQPENFHDVEICSAEFLDIREITTQDLLVKIKE